jgi:hypothetical protein
MTAIITIVATVTLLLITALICATIQARPATPCLLQDSVLYVGESRFQGGTCSGKAENLYVSARPATAKLDGMRACNAHMIQLQGAADALVRESA